MTPLSITRPSFKRVDDRIAAVYDEARTGTVHLKVDLLMQKSADGASILEWGVVEAFQAQTLAQRFHERGRYFWRQIRRARLNVPAATLIHGDMMAGDFFLHLLTAWLPFTAFSICQAKEPQLLRRIHTWLKPGGYF